MTLLHRTLLLALCLPAGVAANAVSEVQIMSAPATIYLEQMPDAQHLNFDLVVDNGSEVALDIDRIELSVFDRDGALLLQRFVDSNGVRPSLDVLGDRSVAARTRRSVFNPFPAFAQELDIALLRIDIELSNGDGSVGITRSLTIKPTVFRNHVAYVPPLSGRFINYDGHDALGHHRRFDVEFAPIKAMGFKTNAMRYSYDFVPVHPDGAMYDGDFADNTAWFGFDQPIRAIGDGTVVALESAKDDNRQFDQSRLAEDRMLLFGNHVVVDHGGGEFAVYAHARKGSASVKVGDRVRRGQTIARIGASGSAFFPHLHFQLQDGPDLDAEGLPSYFSRFERVLGKRSIQRKRASIDTGEIVQAE